MKNALKGKTVLLVDDNAMNIFALSHFLESEDMNVIVAESGFEAIDYLLKQEPIDIVLLDMMMPQMDGFETLSRLKELQLIHSVPIIAVTANAMKGDREKCLRAGATDYLSKPVDLRELLSKMEQLSNRAESNEPGK